MATNYPGSLDTFTNPTTATFQSDSPPLRHDVQHANVNDAIRALQVKVGITGSTDATSIEKRLTDGLAAKQDKLTAGSNITIVGTTISASGSGGSAALLDTPFATAIPLDLVQGREMGSKTIDADTTFTVAGGAVTNGSCNVTLLGDGTHTIDLSAFQNGNGFTFNKTLNKINELAFLKRPNAAYVFGVVGGTYSAPETIATLSSPAGTATGDTTASLSVTTDRASGTLYVVVVLASDTVPTAAQIKAGHNAADAAAKYAGNKIVSASGAQAFSATGLAATTAYKAYFLHTNTAGDSVVAVSASFTTSAAPTQQVVRFQTLNLQITESGNSTDGWVYTNAAGGGNWWTGSNGGITNPDKSLSGDGYVTAVIAGGSPGHALGLSTIATYVDGVNSWEYCILTWEADWIGRVWKTQSLGAGLTTSSVAVAEGDILKLERSGSSVIASIAKSTTPASFTTIKTWTGVPAGKLYPQMATENVGIGGQKMGPVRGLVVAA